MGTRNAGACYQPKQEYIITDPMSVARSSKQTTNKCIMFMHVSKGCLMFSFAAFLHVLQINHPAFRKCVWPLHFSNSKTFLLPVLPYDQEKAPSVSSKCGLTHLPLPPYSLHMLLVTYLLLSPNFFSKHRNRKKGHHHETTHGNYDLSFFRLAYSD